MITRIPETKGKARGEGSVGPHQKSPDSDLGTQPEVKSPFCGQDGDERKSRGKLDLGRGDFDSTIPSAGLFSRDLLVRFLYCLLSV